MAIAFETSSSTIGNTCALSCCMPGGVVAGDVVVAQWVSRVAACNLFLPTGWVEVASAQGAASLPKMKLAYLVATGAETATCSFARTGGGNHGVGLSRWSGVDTANVSDATATAGSGTNASAIAPAVTTATASAMLISFVGEDNAGVNVSPPTGFVEIHETAVNAKVQSAYMVQDVAGNSGDEQSNLASSIAWLAMLWALKPAGAGGGGNGLMPGMLQAMTGITF